MCQDPCHWCALAPGTVRCQSRKLGKILDERDGCSAVYLESTRCQSREPWAWDDQEAGITYPPLARWNLLASSVLSKLRSNPTRSPPGLYHVLGRLRLPQPHRGCVQNAPHGPFRAPCGASDKRLPRWSQSEAHHTGTTGDSHPVEFTRTPSLQPQSCPPLKTRDLDSPFRSNLHEKRACCGDAGKQPFEGRQPSIEPTPSPPHFQTPRG